MKNIILSGLLLLSINASATIWAVEAGGGGIGNPDPYFSPNSLVILLGDTVQWNNVQGMHSVDGTDSDNPETFMFDSADAPWTFEFQFTVPGSYYVECSVSNHAATQNMTIDVLDIVEGIEDLSASEFLIFPNPLTLNSTLTFPEVNADAYHCTISDYSGRIIKTLKSNGNSTSVLNRSDFETGVYIISLYRNGAIARNTRLIVN